MASPPLPDPETDWLTPLQRGFLERFFEEDTGRHFFLTGGTALAAFHLHHRLSVDLGLFTLDDLAFREAAVIVPRLAIDLACSLVRERRTEHFAEYLLQPEVGDLLQVDLVRDVGPQDGKRVQIGEICVDSLKNIGANKLTAILGRSEPKDVVDLYFILQAGSDFDELLAMAQEKDLGLQPFYLAGSLLQASQLSILPVTRPPISSAELREFALGLANRLLDEQHP